MKPIAKSILNHTNDSACSEINLPKMAVNPHINTIKWRCN